MDDKTGKYILFCSNIDAMNECMGLASKWFAKVDKNPHIYSVYSGDPKSSQFFDDFTKDSDTSHLRLLYCIDALNEGIHLDDISGVILFRPTVSPIICKQHIGRDLSAGCKKNPVVFDVVNNIENLYSIDTIREEMEAAITYTELEEIAPDIFVIDEIHRTGAPMWNKRVTVLLNMYPNVPMLRLSAANVRYLDNQRDMAEELFDGNIASETDSGFDLGYWLCQQRKNKSKLSDEQIKALDSIGMIWVTQTEKVWGKGFEHLVQHKSKFGNVKPAVTYKSEDRYMLGYWVSVQKKRYADGKLDEKQIAKLSEIGVELN
ncbi:MAG: Helicase associated domain protein [Oscillospiraceae bacterium]|nr:Helicase associated domain protein [Oscillospiraceae bacterium]